MEFQLTIRDGASTYDVQFAIDDPALARKRLAEVMSDLQKRYAAREARAPSPKAKPGAPTAAAPVREG